ncbi:MAG: GNAT family N-acetyltransferase [Cyanobacteria bacterium P01_H01_bin.153]
MTTHTKTRFRPATVQDCPTAAGLMQIAADGVCDYIWSLQQDKFPELTLLEIGIKRYAAGEGNFSYRNCTLAYIPGDRTQERIQGMIMAFAIPPEAPEPQNPESSEEMLPGMEVLAPYALEQPNSWYICALAVFPEYRRQGIGVQLLDLAFNQARDRNFPSVSLLCFEQNTGALRLYQRYGFRVIDRTAVVPHPLIHHTGDVLLMTKPV